jgi:ribosomal-protein-alanine N-acetyltransferase
MRYEVDRMTLADIPRVVEIERLAYASPWPSSAYRKEIQENPLARYIVVRDARRAATIAPSPAPEVPRRIFPLSLLHARAAPTYGPRVASVVGFSGLWLMVDEAHVTTIAVHPDSRGRGVGELMLSSLITVAYEFHARRVSLEVRVSNTVAQSLYRKYGFHSVGILRRYYSDNNEDALKMWTDEIASPTYRERFAQLRAALERRLAAEDGEPGAAGRGATAS